MALPEDVLQDLCAAAFLHDVSKKWEKSLPAGEGGLSWDEYERQVTGHETESLRKAGYNDRVIRLVHAVAFDSLVETLQILDKKELSPEDLAFLVLHYVDDYTRGDEWAEPAETVNGETINELDRRMMKNQSNPTLININKDGKARFGGESSFVAQRRIGHIVEERLAGLLSDKTGKRIESLRLPELIDNRVREQMSAFI